MSHEPTALDIVPRQDADWVTIDWIASLSNEDVRKQRQNKLRGVVSHPYTEVFASALVCGVVLGALGVFGDACSHWVSSIRLGICAHFFWLVPSLCCVDGEECEEYYSWGEFFLGRDNGAIQFVDFAMYVVFSTAAAAISCMLCRVYSCYAAGGGIAEVKTIVSGHRVRRYLGGWTLFTKLIAMCFSTGSGLVVGKEGPFVHIGACVGGIVSGLFPSFKNQLKERDLITTGAGGGMAVAFGAPVGGAIFALEEVAGIYSFKTMVATLVCGVTAVIIQSRVDLWHTGRIVQFSINYTHGWHFFELPFFALIGAFGGFVGAAFNTVNLHVTRWRKAHLKQWRMQDVLVVAAITGAVNFVTPYGKGSLLDLLSDCFQDCTPDSALALCHGSEWSAFLYLLITATLKLVLFTFTVGVFLPAGILVPSLAIGALYGRAFGMLLRAIQESYSSSFVFTECSDQDLCVIPGMYAVVGAAALLNGVTRLTICLAIIMFELTASLDYMVPVVIGVLCAKAAAEALGVEGSYEIGIEENGLPYLDPKKEFLLDFAAKDVYATKQFTVLTAHGLTIQNINNLVNKMNVSGFPVVESADDPTLLGYVPVKALVRAIQAAAASSANLNPNTLVRFGPPGGGGGAAAAREEGGGDDSNDTVELDFTHVLEPCTLQVEPSTPVRQLLVLFQSLGTHHVMVCQLAEFKALISKKDMINFMREKEKEELMEDEEIERARHKEK